MVGRWKFLCVFLLPLCAQTCVCSSVCYHLHCNYWRFIHQEYCTVTSKMFLICGSISEKGVGVFAVV